MAGNDPTCSIAPAGHARGRLVEMGGPPWLASVRGWGVERAIRQLIGCTDEARFKDVLRRGLTIALKTAADAKLDLGLALCPHSHVSR